MIKLTNLLLELDRIGKFSKNMKVNVIIDKSVHAKERQGRHEDTVITDDQIRNVVSAATEKIVDKLIFNKINIEDRVLIKQVATDLNVVGVLKQAGDNLDFIVITVMKEKDFRNIGNTFTIVV